MKSKYKIIFHYVEPETGEYENRSYHYSSVDDILDDLRYDLSQMLRISEEIVIQKINTVLKD